MPAIGTTLTGLAAGYVIRSGWTMREQLRALVTASAAALVLGGAWALVFPLNKSLWTSSYVLVTSGFAGLLLAAPHGALDTPHRTFRFARPFVILGRNALLLFVVSGFLAKTLGLIHVGTAGGGSVALGRWIYVSWFAPFAAPKNASLLFAAANLAVLFALLWWLDRRRWYFRV
jgi:predicted acyltransferase